MRPNLTSSLPVHFEWAKKKYWQTTTNLADIYVSTQIKIGWVNINGVATISCFGNGECVCVYLAYFGWWSIYGKRAKLWLYINKTGGNGKKARPVHRWHMCNDTKNYVSPRISQTMEIECAREIKTIRIYHFAIWMQSGNGMRKRDRRRSCLWTF